MDVGNEEWPYKLKSKAAKELALEDSQNKGSIYRTTKTVSRHWESALCFLSEVDEIQQRTSSSVFQWK